MSVFFSLAVLATILVDPSSCLDLDEHQTKPATTFAQCQLPTDPPLDGCPPGAIYVSQSDPNARFYTIQDAISSLPEGDEAVILIAPGNYTEQVNVTRSAPLTLLGVSSRPHDAVPYSAIDVDDSPSNEVQVWWNSANINHNLPDNSHTSVLSIGPTYESPKVNPPDDRLGAGPDAPFGCERLSAYNMDFRNDYAHWGPGPAHAVGLGRSNAGFYSCGMYGYQDTIFIGRHANAYFYDSILAGQTDYLYGYGTVYIEQCTLYMRGCGGGITAWKGDNATTFPNKYGAYIDKSRVIGSNSTIAKQKTGKCALGRPWNAQHRSIFMNTYVSAMILPELYKEWRPDEQRVDQSTFMAAYDLHGPGYNASAAVNNMTHMLNDQDVKPYRWPVDVFQMMNGSSPNLRWIDQSVLAPLDDRKSSAAQQKKS